MKQDSGAFHVRLRCGKQVNEVFWNVIAGGKPRMFAVRADLGMGKRTILHQVGACVYTDYSKWTSGQAYAVLSVCGAGGGIRTHGGLRQRILSPPPCLRLFLALPI